MTEPNHDGNQHERIQEVAPGVFVGIPYPYDGAMAMVVGDTHTLVVDGTSYRLFAEQMMAEVERRTRPQRRILALTHRHFDHFAGLAAFPEPILAPAGTRDALTTYDAAWIDENVPYWIEHDMLKTEWLGTPEVRLPEINFADRVSIDLGGLTVEMIHVGGHVDEIAVAWIPDREVLIASDTIGNGRDLYLDESNGPAWIDAMRRLQQLPAAVVVPGHGPVGGHSLIDSQLEALERADHDAPRRSA